MSIYVDPLTTDPGILKQAKVMATRMFNNYMLEVAIGRFELTQTILDWYIDILNEDITAFNNIPTDVQTAYDGVLTPAVLQPKMTSTVLFSGSIDDGDPPQTLLDSIHNYHIIVAKISFGGTSYRIIDFPEPMVIYNDEYAYTYTNDSIRFTFTDATTVDVPISSGAAALVEVRGIKFN